MLPSPPSCTSASTSKLSLRIRLYKHLRLLASLFTDFTIAPTRFGKY